MHVGKHNNYRPITVPSFYNKPYKLAYCLYNLNNTLDIVIIYIRYINDSIQPYPTIIPP